MRRRSPLLSLLLILALLLAACGGEEPPTADTTPAATESGDTGKTFKVGVVQQVSHPALDAARQGIKDAFGKSGLSVQIIEQNAQNQTDVLKQIAEGFRDQDVDLVIAIGSQPLQAAYNALSGSDTPIVFNSVANPYVALPDIIKSETEHANVTGMQALPPVADAFDLITEIKPDAKKVGIIWTTSEPNSKAATDLARAHAQTRGIEFVESTVTKADEVLAAAENLASQEVDAIFISTDSTVVSALDSVVKVANETQTLLVCNDPASAIRGCTAALGLDYYDNGVISANDFAIPILKGEKKAEDLPIRKQEKKNIALNLEAAQLQGVTIPDALRERADDDKINDKIVPKPSPTAGDPAAPTTTVADGPTPTAQSSGGDRSYVVGVVQQATHPALDAARDGIADAFSQSGMKVELIDGNAQNDPATLTQIVEGYVDRRVDMIIAIGTQPLQAAYTAASGSGIPIVFNTVANPYAAIPDVIKSETEHAGVTGMQALPPVTQGFDLITEIKPEAKKVGIIWTTSEKNSETATNIAREHAQSRGIRFIETTVTKGDEVLAAAERLSSEGVDAIFISTDTTVVSALESVVKVSNETQTLLVCNDPASAKRGCTAALGLDYYDNGYISTTELAIPILKGEKTADETPIMKQEKEIIAVNTEAARLQGVVLPESLRTRVAKENIYDTIGE